jgi:hypothetical protein
MVSKELEAAKAAKMAINAPAPNSASLARLRAAKDAAVLNLGTGGALNEARVNAGIALYNLSTPERMDKAKAAIDAWIRELEAAGG